MERKKMTVQERTVRVGRRMGRWQYVVDRFNGDRWRLDGTTIDLEFDPIPSVATGRRGEWVLYVGDLYVEPISAFLTGYCCAMYCVEEAVDADPAPGEPSWATRGRAELIAAGDSRG